MAPQSICSVPGCDNLAHAKSFCQMHYMRDKRGTPMDQTKRLLIAGDTIIQVLLAETDDCITWPLARDEYGYGLYTGGGKKQQVHRLICKIKHGRPPSSKHQAAHSCGKGSQGCVNHRHLRWATPAENSADRVLHGTLVRGSAAYNAKLTEDSAAKVKAMLRDGRPVKDIALEFSVSKGVVYSILHGVTWKHVA